MQLKTIQGDGRLWVNSGPVGAGVSRPDPVDMALVATYLKRGMDQFSDFFAKAFFLDPARVTTSAQIEFLIRLYQAAAGLVCDGRVSAFKPGQSSATVPGTGRPYAIVSLARAHIRWSEQGAMDYSAGAGRKFTCSQSLYNDPAAPPSVTARAGTDTW